MRTTILTLLVALSLALLTAGHAGARVIGGSPTAGCYATFEGVTPSATSPNRVECMDGDVCDADGQVNGSCTFTLSVCAFQTDVPGCTPHPVVKFIGPAKKILKLPDTSSPISSPTCAAASSVTVRIRGKRPAGRKKIMLKAVSSGSPKADKNKISLVCMEGSGTTTTGVECPNNPAGGPRQATYTVADHGTDLDTGTSGVSHNFPIIAMAHSRLCLTECDGTTNPVCKASGPTGKGTFNGETFGPPLPLFAANVATCVINNFADPAIQGTVDIQKGTYESKVGGVDTPVRLNSMVFNTSATQVCPQCKGGTCDLGPSAGKSCQVDGTVRVINPSQGINQLYSLSRSCPPGPPQGSLTGTIPIELPVTSGTSTLTGRCPGQTTDDDCGSNGGTCVADSCLNQPDVKGGFNQSCCSVGGAPCFPTANGGSIVRTGTPMAATPPWPDPTYPKMGTGGKLVATFCIGTSHSILIDGVAGLPGPGAVVFNGTAVLDGNQ